MKPFLSVLAAAVLFAAPALPAEPLTEPPAEPLRVVATVGMIADIARSVGGACVDVTVIMGPGVDPHLYQARPGDVRALQKADLILYSGYFLEGQLSEVLDKFGERKPTLAVSPAAINRADLIETGEGYGVDPHLWMDVGLWSRLVPTIAETLSEMRPACGARIAASERNYGTQLAALDDWVGAAIATIPEGQRTLVTAHDAFAYYGRAYGIAVASIQGVSTQAEPGIADIRATADLIAETGVPAIFVESSVSPRTVEAVIEAARQRGAKVEIGGRLFSDAMGEQGTPGGTYIGMIVENTRAITRALGGTPPDLPPALDPWSSRWPDA